MKKIIFATGNEGKMREVRMILQDLGVEILSLKEAGIAADVEENGTTFEENAVIKATEIMKMCGEIVLADDSGLEVDAMDKAPGVYSARFLGYDTPYEEKNQYIMDQVKGKTRTARYVCAIAYVEEDGAGHVFTGVVEGEIADHARGEKGFGYDPIFYYPPYGATLAEVSEEKKNAISHRGCALAQLIAYMKEAER